MTTEQYSIGYEEGYQAGWNAAMDAKPAQQEPVAWMWRCKPYCNWPEWNVSLQRPADSGCDGNKRTEGYEDIPLYNAPQPQRQPQQEPVATVKAKREGGTFVLWTKRPVAGMTLYTTPQPAQQQEPICKLFGTLPVYDRAAQQEQNRQIDQLIQERDHRDEIIDKLCDAVLGPDRYEWSSQYFFEDAVREVEERMAEQPAQQEPVGCAGAIVNGRVYADRLEHDYKFECEAGPLHLCNDWVEFRRCFEWLAQHTSPPAQRKPLTDEMVVAAARVLSDRQAALCNVDCGDMWKIHGNDFLEDARAALEAAHGIKGDA